MENTLETLFDYFKFEGNSSLQNLIEESHARTLYGRKSGSRRVLTLEEADYVAAAGDPEVTEQKTPKHPIIIRSQDNSVHA